MVKLSIHKLANVFGTLSILWAVFLYGTVGAHSDYWAMSLGTFVTSTGVLSSSGTIVDAVGVSHWAYGPCVIHSDSSLTCEGGATFSGNYKSVFSQSLTDVCAIRTDDTVDCFNGSDPSGTWSKYFVATRSYPYWDNRYCWITTAGVTTCWSFSGTTDVVDVTYVYGYNYYGDTDFTEYCILKADQSVSCERTSVFTGSYIDISGGYQSVAGNTGYGVCAIRTDGTIQCKDGHYNYGGYLASYLQGHEPSGTYTSISVASGQAYAVRASDNIVVSFGYYWQSESSVPAGDEPGAGGGGAEAVPEGFESYTGSVRTLVGTGYIDTTPEVYPNPGTCNDGGLLFPSFFRCESSGSTSVSYGSGEYVYDFKASMNAGGVFNAPLTATGIYFYPTGYYLTQTGTSSETKVPFFADWQLATDSDYNSGFDLNFEAVHSDVPAKGYVDYPANIYPYASLEYWSVLVGFWQTATLTGSAASGTTVQYRAEYSGGEVEWSPKISVFTRWVASRPFASIEALVDAPDDSMLRLSLKLGEVRPIFEDVVHTYYRPVTSTGSIGSDLFGSWSEDTGISDLVLAPVKALAGKICEKSGFCKILQYVDFTVPLNQTGALTFTGFVIDLSDGLRPSYSEQSVTLIPLPTWWSGAAFSGMISTPLSDKLEENAVAWPRATIFVLFGLVFWWLFFAMYVAFIGAPIFALMSLFNYVWKNLTAEYSAVDQGSVWQLPVMMAWLVALAGLGSFMSLWIAAVVNLFVLVKPVVLAMLAMVLASFGAYESWAVAVNLFIAAALLLVAAFVVKQVVRQFGHT